MRRKKKKVMKSIKKYYRWFRRSWYKIVEAELGYEIHAC